MIFGIALVLAIPAAQAKKNRPKEVFPLHPLTPDQKRLVDESMTHEKTVIRQIEKSTPVVQTYIQNMRPDPHLYQIPVSDQFMVGRVDFGKAFVADEYSMRQEHTSFFGGSMKFVSQLTKAFHLENSPTGFMSMMFLDPTSYDEQHYNFQFVRREFLGTVRTWVFDVRPKQNGVGRFIGRIWIEDQDGNLVRFNGTYINNPNNDTSHYFHFDSWRMNLQPGLWAPAA
ncbi:MAG TPA: hypothetical protein VN541_10715, partial [Tepidisphaeraceae bacterium]|nr:hypothetical protein [Tepidisphaeraceae bacterium]